MTVETLRKKSCVAGEAYPVEPSIEWHDDPPLVRLIVDEPTWVRFREGGQETLVRPPGASFYDYRTDAPETGVSRLWARQAGEERAYVVVIAEPRVAVPIPSPVAELPPDRVDPKYPTRFTSRAMRDLYVRRTLGRG